MSISEATGRKNTWMTPALAGIAIGIAITLGPLWAAGTFTSPAELTFDAERAETLRRMEDQFYLEQYQGPNVAEHEQFAFTFDGNLIIVNSTNGPYVVCASHRFDVYSERGEQRSMRCAGRH